MRTHDGKSSAPHITPGQSSVEFAEMSSEAMSSEDLADQDLADQDTATQDLTGQLREGLVRDAERWSRHPRAAALVDSLRDKFCERSAACSRLAERMAKETGTRLRDWVDHLAWPRVPELELRLHEAGFRPQSGDAGGVVWRHGEGMFPAIVLHDEARRKLAIKVESVSDFLFAAGIDSRTPIFGEPLSPLRMAAIDEQGDTELWIVERHGYALWRPLKLDPLQAPLVLAHQEEFRRRRRHFTSGVESEWAGFQEASRLIAAAIEDLGRDWACDLFFAAEREYWQSRNRAGQIQKARQDALGLGWANHDHHTYRSSRAHFKDLIAVLEQLGFECRERFYGGREAGWGAQVLEQPVAKIVIFADVDLSPEEVAGDFAHEPLPPRDKLGTVGLWCRLHGEAFLQAGLHHLECQFDFDAARDGLKGEGVATMKPFTDFAYLRQAFTQGEMWPVAAERIDWLLADKLITPEQAEKFRQEGAIGSHLEILQREEGYKGFNQSGVSDIIRQTDPRRAK
jgi:hypothetical protein